MEVASTVVRLRLAETFVIAREARDWEDVVQVEVRHGGDIGRGEAAPIDRYDETAESALAFVEQHGDLLGDDPFALEQIGERLAEIPGEHAAKAALDGALHDLQGKLLGVPVWKLLGLPRSGPPTSWTIWLGDPDDMARRTELVGDRFKRLKLKLGGGDGLDVERVRAVRSRTDLPLQIDVNEWWSLDEALESIPQLVELGVAYVEQPLPAGDRRRGGAPGEVPDSDLRRRGLPLARGRGALRRDRARHQHQAREVGWDPRGDSHGACRARARSRRDARLHGRVGHRHRRRVRRRAALRPRRPRRQPPARRGSRAPASRSSTACSCLPEEPGLGVG